MPREQITHNPNRIVTNQSLTGNVSNEITAVGHNVHVDWSEDHVSVGVDVGLGEIKSIASPSEDVGWPDVITMRSDSMSRKDINKLISTLRRARDKAYGADA